MSFLLARLSPSNVVISKRVPQVYVSCIENIMRECYRDWKILGSSCDSSLKDQPRVNSPFSSSAWMVPSPCTRLLVRSLVAVITVRRFRFSVLPFEKIICASRWRYSILLLGISSFFSSGRSADNIRNEIISNKLYREISWTDSKKCKRSWF